MFPTNFLIDTATVVLVEILFYAYKFVSMLIDAKGDVCYEFDSCLP